MEMTAIIITWPCINYLMAMQYCFFYTCSMHKGNFQLEQTCIPVTGAYVSWILIQFGSVCSEDSEPEQAQRDYGGKARWGAVETESRAARDQSIIAPVALYWLWGPTGPQRSMCFQAFCVGRWRSVAGLMLTFVCVHLRNALGVFMGTAQTDFHICASLGQPLEITTHKYNITIIPTVRPLCIRRIEHLFEFIHSSK